MARSKVASVIKYRRFERNVKAKMRELGWMVD